MARIVYLERVVKERPSLHDTVESSFSSFEIEGMNYVQIDTYGRKGRMLPGKVSQSLQIDRAVAEQLIQILKQSFPEIT